MCGTSNAICDRFRSCRIARAKYDQGVRNFALLFTRWMDLNGWSHPVMVALAKSALDGTSWLHSSQISGLRHGKLVSPGPRTFKAIQVLNYYLWLYKTEEAHPQYRQLKQLPRPLRHHRERQAP